MANGMGHVAVLVKSHVNGLKPFEHERTIEQTTETMPPSPKTTTAANKQENNKSKRTAKLLQNCKFSTVL